MSDIRRRQYIVDAIFDLFTEAEIRGAARGDEVPVKRRHDIEFFIIRKAPIKTPLTLEVLIRSQYWPLATEYIPYSAYRKWVSENWVERRSQRSQGEEAFFTEADVVWQSGTPNNG